MSYSDHTEVKKKANKVAIVGSASSSRDKAPWDDHSFEIWGLAWRKLKRAERHFDIHKFDDEHLSKKKGYLEHLGLLEGPIYLQEKHKDYANSIAYPYDEVVNSLQLDEYSNGEYFVSSIAYMIGLAIYEQFEEIHLYGIDLIDDDEYAYQRPNTEYLLGLARGRGIKVYIPEESSLLKFSYRYGYERTPKNEEGIITTEMLTKQRAEYLQKRDNAIQAANTFDGALQTIDGLLKTIKFTKRGMQASK